MPLLALRSRRWTADALIHERGRPHDKLGAAEDRGGLGNEVSDNSGVAQMSRLAPYF